MFPPCEVVYRDPREVPVAVGHWHRVTKLRFCLQRAISRTNRNRRIKHRPFIPCFENLFAARFPKQLRFVRQQKTKKFCALRIFGSEVDQFGIYFHGQPFRTRSECWLFAELRGHNSLCNQMSFLFFNWAFYQSVDLFPLPSNWSVVPGLLRLLTGLANTIMLTQGRRVEPEVHGTAWLLTPKSG